MPAVARAVYCLVVVVGPAGCLVGELSGIPCDGDRQCPSQHFCDVPNDVCVPVTADDSAPDLAVIGVENRGEVQLDPFVPPDQRTTLELLIENQGLRSADDVALELVPLACMDLQFDPTTVPQRIGAGEQQQVSFSVAPHGCSTPSIEDWFLFYSGRSERGTFNINVERAPPSAD
jgi:hypothetical protein